MYPLISLNNSTFYETARYIQRKNETKIRCKCCDVIKLSHEVRPHAEPFRCQCSSHPAVLWEDIRRVDYVLGGIFKFVLKHYGLPFGPGVEKPIISTCI